MSDLQALFHAVDKLTPDERRQLLAYIQQTYGAILDQQSTPRRNKPRILGLHSHLGAAWMSDDFNDELPDSFWLGEE